MRKYDLVRLFVLVVMLSLVVAATALAAPSEGKVTPAPTSAPSSITVVDFLPDSTQNKPAACVGQMGCGERCYVAPSGAMDCEPFVFYLGPNQ